MSDPAPLPDGVPPGSVQDTADPELWHAPPADPAAPDAETWPTDAADDPSYPPLPAPDPPVSPTDPGYNPDFDPAVGHPDNPVPGLVGDDAIQAELVAAVAAHTAPAPDYPDADAPSDPATMAANTQTNAEGAVPYQTTLRAIAADGTQTDWSIYGPSLDQIRITARAWLLCPPWGHANWPPTVLLQTFDVIAQKYVDLSGANPNPDPSWDGWNMVEVRVMCPGKL